jgi:hypothetical protein
MTMKWLERIGIVVGVWFWSVIPCMFLGKYFAILEAYATWSCRVLFAVTVIAIVWWVLYRVGYCAHQTTLLYRGAVQGTKAGFFGRIVLAVGFVIAFVLALLFTRW